MLGALLKELAATAGRAAVDQGAKLVRRMLRRESEPSQPLTWRDVDHIRAQERSALEASRAAAAKRRGEKP